MLECYILNRDLDLKCVNLLRVRIYLLELLCSHSETREIDFKTLLHSRYFGEKMALAILKPVILNHIVKELVLIFGNEFYESFDNLEYISIFHDEASSVDTSRSNVSNLKSLIFNCYFENILQGDWFFTGLDSYILFLI